MKTLQPIDEQTHLLLGDSPLHFEEFLHLFAEDADFELMNGVLVERMSAQLHHERLLLSDERPPVHEVLKGLEA